MVSLGIIPFGFTLFTLPLLEDSLAPSFSFKVRIVVIGVIGTSRPLHLTL